MKAFNPSYDMADDMNPQAERNRELIEHVLLAILPHGSGIDCKWEFDWMANGKVRATNSYHCMNENGFYDGYADFSLVFPTLQPFGAFRLAFHGKTAHRKARRYDLRDYLADTINHAVGGSGADVPSMAAIINAYCLRTAGQAWNAPELVREHIESFEG